MRIIEVDLSDESYPIVIGRGLGDALSLLPVAVQKARKIIVTNNTVEALYVESIKEVLHSSEVIVIPDGEAHKTLDTVNAIISKLLESNVSRHAVLVALGGGVVGDITGFVAACYQRGIGFVQYPTTLLAQVDSSVGGKTGVNHVLGKNMIGAFYQPACVLIDTAMLDSLPDREFRAGIAEIIKYGAILDADFFSWLEQNIEQILTKNDHALEYAIARSCSIKSTVVSQDEKESGIRAILNYGHTFGHAIESWGEYRLLVHGEAVAIGMAIAAVFSSIELGFDEGAARRLVGLIRSMGLPVQIPEGMSNDDFLYYMAKDKKNSGDAITLILLDKLGCAKIVKITDMHKISQGLDAARKVLGAS